MFALILLFWSFLEIKDDGAEESGDEPKPEKKPSVKRIHIPGSESAQKHTQYVSDFEPMLHHLQANYMCDKVV